jgi:hypothetical protein
VFDRLQLLFILVFEKQRYESPWDKIKLAEGSVHWDVLNETPDSIKACDQACGVGTQNLRLLDIYNPNSDSNSDSESFTKAQYVLTF